MLRVRMNYFLLVQAYGMLDPGTVLTSVRIPAVRTSGSGRNVQWRSHMGIGASIFLIAVGAVLTFAVNYELAGIDIKVIGVILMIAGAIGAALTALVFGPRRTAARETVVRDTALPTREVVRERETF